MILYIVEIANPLKQKASAIRYGNEFVNTFLESFFSLLKMETNNF